MGYKIAVLAGDGIGPEVTKQAKRVLERIGAIYNHEFIFTEALIGGVAIETTSYSLPPETLQVAKLSDAVLLGAVGDPKYDNPELKERPENGLLAIRKKLKLFANIRPVMIYDELLSGSVIKEDVIRGVDFICVRELTGGLYFGKPKKRWVTGKGRRAVDTMSYSELEIERIARMAFELALKRRKKLTSVDKANVLETSRLWRQVVSEVSKDYPGVELEHMLVDTCAMRMILSPRDFDVLVTENTFGDILTDEASMLAGSMGLLPSASVAEIGRSSKKMFGLYEPIHGSAPTIAGKNIANPIATILSVSMLLRLSLGLDKEAVAVEKAVKHVLKNGYRTADIKGSCLPNQCIGTEEMGSRIVDAIAGA